MDNNHDDKVTVKEFQESLPSLKKWGVHIFSVTEEFKNIDFQGDGFVTFDEFSDYCIKKSLFTFQTNIREANKIIQVN